MALLKALREVDDEPSEGPDAPSDGHATDAPAQGEDHNA